MKRRGAPALAASAILAAAAVLTLVVAAVSALAAAPALDPSFGAEGVAAPPLPAAAAEAKAGVVDLAAAPDGGAYAALTGLGTPAFFGLVGLDADGAPDPGFGDGGFTAPLVAPPAGPPAGGLSSSGPEAEAVAVQPDGKILVAGAIASRAYVAEDGNTLESFRPLIVRYLPNGSLDPSFGTEGRVDLPEGVQGVVHDLAVTASGMILAAVGEDLRGSSGSETAIYALGPDGSPDREFGRGGQILSRPSGRSVADPRAISPLPNGGLLVSAYRNSKPVLTRFDADGRADRSFGGGDGFVRSNIPDPRCCGRLPLEIGPDGRAAVAFAAGDRGRVFVARFGPGGELDRGFGDDGVVALPARFEDADGIAAAADGDTYIVGDARHRAGGGISFAYAVARLGGTGRLDRGFGRAGVEVVAPGAASIAGAALALPEGVLVGGSYDARAKVGSTAHRTALLLTRYLP